VLNVRIVVREYAPTLIGVNGFILMNMIGRGSACIAKGMRGRILVRKIMQRSCGYTPVIGDGLSNPYLMMRLPVRIRGMTDIDSTLRLHV